MKTEYFENVGVIGFELTTIQDVLNALSLGMDLIDENEDWLDTDREDEDGNTRRATLDEVVENAQTTLREGGKVYAVIGLPSTKRIVPRASTILRSDFYLGQEVYAMRNNKFIRGEIIYLSLGVSVNDNLLLDERANNLGELVFEMIANEINPRFTNYYCLKKREEVEREYKKVLNDNHVLICVKDKGHKSYYTYGLDEVFASKDELVRHLINE